MFVENLRSKLNLNDKPQIIGVRIVSVINEFPFGDAMIYLADETKNRNSTPGLVFYPDSKRMYMILGAQRHPPAELITDGLMKGNLKGSGSRYLDVDSASYYLYISNSPRWKDLIILQTTMSLEEIKKAMTDAEMGSYNYINKELMQRVRASSEEL